MEEKILINLLLKFKRESITDKSKWIDELIFCAKKVIQNKKKRI